jgi:hypothetical protein
VQIRNLLLAQPTELGAAHSANHVIARTIVDLYY